MKPFLLTYSGYIALFVVVLCLAVAQAPRASAGTGDVSAAPSAIHADYSKCPDPTLPSVSCQTPVTYGTCQVYSYGESGVREFVCDALEPHAFPSGLDTYLGVNRTQTVESMMSEGGYSQDDLHPPFHCPWIMCSQYLVVIRQKTESAH